MSHPVFRTLTRVRIAILAVVLSGLAMRLEATDWPEYRGPNRDGRSTETGLLDAWPESGPTILWRSPLGSGYSGLAVADGRVVTLFGASGDELAAAFDTATGREIWRFRMGGNFRNNQGDGPRSTPAIDGELVFVLGARAKLFALEVATGEVRWSLDLEKELGAKIPEWGLATSPLIEGGQLIIDVAGRKDYGVVAFNTASGEILWHGDSHRAAYSSPIAVTLGGERQIVIFSGEGLRGVSARNGQRLWSSPWTTDWEVNAATPIFVPRSGIFISSDYDTGAALLQIVKESDKFKVYQVWKNRSMKNHFNSSVLVGGFLYGFDMGTLKCLDALTGEEKWRARRGFSKGSLLYADGRFYVLGGDGQLGLIEATPTGYELLSRFEILDSKTWTMPSLSDGVLYIRDFSELLAVDVAGTRSQ